MKKTISLFMVFLLIISMGNLITNAEEITSIEVSNVSELLEAIRIGNTNNGSTTIIVQDGIYTLDSMIHIYNENITVQGKSNDYNKVTIKGKGMYGNVSHIFLVSASNFKVQGLSLGLVKNHVIQVQGEKGASDFAAINTRFFDSYEQLLKVSGKGENGLSSTNGLVDSCLFEYTEGIGPQYYIGGVDAHSSYDWVVENNIFKNIVSPESKLAEHAIHFWSSSKSTLVNNNLILNCDRGIGFGLGSSKHIDGIISNNYIYTTRDVGIGLENASHVKVTGNYVLTENYSNSIEYRFEGTSADISNNVTNKSITKRNGGIGNLSNNTVKDIPFDINNESIIDIVVSVLEDVPSDWASDEIKSLKKQTQLKEDLYSDYKADITRKDFAYLALKLYEELASNSEEADIQIELDTFIDTSDEYILKAYELEIIQGYGNGLFGPKDTINREQVATMLIKALRKANINLNATDISSIAFTDQVDISPWALGSIQLAFKHKIMNGVGNNTILPKDSTSRQEALVLIYNILEQVNDFDIQ